MSYYNIIVGKFSAATKIKQAQPPNYLPMKFNDFLSQVGTQIYILLKAET